MLVALVVVNADILATNARSKRRHELRCLKLFFVFSFLFLNAPKRKLTELTLI